MVELTHAGAGKARIRREYNGDEGRLLHDARQVKDAFAKLPNTNAILMRTACPPMKERWPNWQPGIRMYYAFSFTKHPTLDRHVTVECWRHGEDYLNQTTPRTIVLDLTSFYNEHIDFSSIKVSSIVAEVPDYVEDEAEQKRMAKANAIPVEDPTVGPYKMAKCGALPFRKPIVGSTKEEIVESTRRVIINAYNLTDMPRLQARYYPM